MRVTLRSASYGSVGPVQAPHAVDAWVEVSLRLEPMPPADPVLEIELIGGTGGARAVAPFTLEHIDDHTVRVHAPLDTRYLSIGSVDHVRVTVRAASELAVVDGNLETWSTAGPVQGPWTTRGPKPT